MSNKDNRPINLTMTVPPNDSEYYDIYLSLEELDKKYPEVSDGAQKWVGYWTTGEIITGVKPDADR